MNKTDPRAGKSRAALLEAGIDLLSKNSAATLSEIAMAAGVGRATLYRHFETREQLIVELATESLAETDRACAHILEQKLNGRKAIEQIFIAIMPLANRFHFLLTLWSEVSKNKDLKKTYDRQLSQLETRIAEAKAEKSIDKALPNEWLVSLIDNLLYTGWYYIGTGSLTPKQASKLATRSFFHGVS